MNSGRKRLALESVNTALLRTLNPDHIVVHVERAGEAEMDEMWSFVGKKKEPRWLWHAIDHGTGAVLAYVFGRRKDEVFLKLKALLEPFGLTRYYTDHWGAYTRHLDPDVHSPGKRNTQKIERKHLTLRTRIKRLSVRPSASRKPHRCTTSSLACLSTAMPLDGRYKRGYLHF